MINLGKDTREQDWKMLVMKLMRGIAVAITVTSHMACVTRVRKFAFSQNTDILDVTRVPPLILRLRT